ncbi:MAG: hypothetical protein JST29_01415 [Bacteroidetes bacterium]|nr:hypothetical protein [Bacteroidota bacterium]
MAEEVRPTNDVDIIIELWAHKDYADVEEKLRLMGFVNDIESGIMCRYRVQGIIVDIMPTDENILGFSNKWYPEGFRNAIDYNIDSNTSVKIFTINYFIASKLEAFKGRGKNDGRTSSDFEDIIYIFENSKSVWDDMQMAESELKKYLKNEFKMLLNNSFFEEWVDAHAGYNNPPATYFIIQQIEDFVNDKMD